MTETERKSKIESLQNDLNNLKRFELQEKLDELTRRKLQRQLDTLGKAKEEKKVPETKPLEVPTQPVVTQPVAQEQRLPGLGEQFEEMGKTMGNVRDSIPHIKIGGDNKTKIKPLPVIQSQGIQPQGVYEPTLVDKLRRWTLIALFVIVGGGAIIAVLSKIIVRLF